MRYMPSRITARRRNSTRPPAGGTSGPRGCSTRVRTARKWSAAPWPSSCAATSPRAPSSPRPRRRCRKLRGGAAGGTGTYRYAWLRDAAFVLFALDRVGFYAEADGFLQFLKRVCRRADARHVQIMYGVDGRRDLPEQVLEHFDGYRGARPVRVGNGAAQQLQLDVYGELLDTVDIWRRHHAMTEGVWKVLQHLVDWTATQRRDPDLSS